jgi:hypothetical protein
LQTAAWAVGSSVGLTSAAPAASTAAEAARKERVDTAVDVTS